MPAQVREPQPATAVARWSPPGAASFDAVESVWIEPPDFQPPAIAVTAAPPPMLVQPVPRRPFADAVWIGGYWSWQRRWLWAHGLWSATPRAGLRWVHPSYEHRDGLVFFTAGHWAPGSAAHPGSTRQRIAAVAGRDEGRGDAALPVGPDGPFVPAPPGSRPGLIVPAPAGTAPAVVTGVPAIVATGMQIEAGAEPVDGVAQLWVTAPAHATASGRAVRLRIPQPAELAAAMPTLGAAMAPLPRSELSLRYVTAGSAKPLADRLLASAARPRPPLGDRGFG